MRYEVRVRKPAREDLEDAALWYEAQRAGLGNEFIDEVERTFEKIAEMPENFRVLHRETRRAILQRFLLVSSSVFSSKLLSWLQSCTAAAIHIVGSSAHNK